MLESDSWRNAEADDDEQVVLIAALDGENQRNWTRKPARRKRVSAISVLLTLLIPFLFLLWMTSWASPSPLHPPSDSKIDAFVLDPQFDKSASQQTRVYRWTVSQVMVGDTNRTRTVVNGRSPGPLIEANAHDRILVCYMSCSFSHH